MLQIDCHEIPLNFNHRFDSRGPQWLMLQDGGLPRKVARNRRRDSLSPNREKDRARSITNKTEQAESDTETLPQQLPDTYIPTPHHTMRSTRRGAKHTKQKQDSETGTHFHENRTWTNHLPQHRRHALLILAPCRLQPQWSCFFGVVQPVPHTKWCAWGLDCNWASFTATNFLDIVSLQAW